MPKHQSFCWYPGRPFPRPLVDKLQMHPYINPLSMKNTSDIYQPLRSRQSQSSGILKDVYKNKSSKIPTKGSFVTYQEDIDLMSICILTILI